MDSRRRLSYTASHSGKKVVGIEDILREGQKVSEMEDDIPTSVATTEILPPPPPKRSSLVKQSK